MSDNQSLCSLSTIEPYDRWRTLGPWTCMFPKEFVQNAIDMWTNPGGTVFDPFCGRGTTQFVAHTLNRRAYGCDLSPVAWVYAATKLHPTRHVDVVLRRTREISRAVRKKDCYADNEFQRFAWHPHVLGFLNTARRKLQWRTSNTDRTLMAFILHYLHGHLGRSLSNQMRPGVAMAPDYAIQWWKERGMRPPKIDPLEFFQEKILWRYDKGIPSNSHSPIARAVHSDAQRWMSRTHCRFNLLITSPPYRGLVDYRKDQWTRMWMLGEQECHAYGVPSMRSNGIIAYETMIANVFAAARRKAKPKAVILVRTDARKNTLHPTIRALDAVLTPRWRGWAASVISPKRTPLNVFGSDRVTETDLLFLPHSMRPPRGSGFKPLTAEI